MCTVYLDNIRLSVFIPCCYLFCFLLLRWQRSISQNACFSVCKLDSVVCPVGDKRRGEHEKEWELLRVRMLCVYLSQVISHHKSRQAFTLRFTYTCFLFYANPSVSQRLLKNMFIIIYSIVQTHCCASMYTIHLFRSCMFLCCPLLGGGRFGSAEVWFMVTCSRWMFYTVRNTVTWKIMTSLWCLAN